MALSDQGRAQPTGIIETIEGDSLILAIGQHNDTELTKNIAEIQHKEDSMVVVNINMIILSVRLLNFNCYAA